MDSPVLAGGCGTRDRRRQTAAVEVNPWTLRPPGPRRLCGVEPRQAVDRVSLRYRCGSFSQWNCSRSKRCRKADRVMTTTAVFMGAGASAALGYPVTNQLLPKIVRRLQDKTLFS